MNRSGKVTVRVKKAARVQQLVEKSGVSSHARSDVKKMNDLKVAAGCVKGAVPLEIDQSQLQQALARGGVGAVSKLLSERRVVNMVLESPDYLLNSVVFWCPILGCSKPRHTLNGSSSTKYFYSREAAHLKAAHLGRDSRSVVAARIIKRWEAMHGKDPPRTLEELNSREGCMLVMDDDWIRNNLPEPEKVRSPPSHEEPDYLVVDCDRTPDALEEWVKTHCSPCE